MGPHTNGVIKLTFSYEFQTYIIKWFKRTKLIKTSNSLELSDTYCLFLLVPAMPLVGPCLLRGKLYAFLSPISTAGCRGIWCFLELVCNMKPGGWSSRSASLRIRQPYTVHYWVLSIGLSCCPGCWFSAKFCLSSWVHLLQGTKLSVNKTEAQRMGERSRENHWQNLTPNAGLLTRALGL